MGGADNERILRSKKRHFFEVLHKALTYKQLHGFLNVNGLFTKSEFARGKVLVRESLPFVVWKTMFDAMKHNLWRGQSLPFAVWNLSFRKMKNDEWRVKTWFLHNLTSLSSLFPDKFLSGFFTAIPLAFQRNKCSRAIRLESCFEIRKCR